MTDSPLELRGKTAPFTRLSTACLLVLVAVGLWFRLRGLSAEGFADDEVHKWLAANRYLHGDFSGDDVEHPMLMKSLITFCLLIGSRLHWQPEAITRLPNALAGGVSIWAVAMLGRRLFGNGTALIAAALASVCCTLIGYQRVAKEDTLLGLFLMLMLWCLAEAKAAADDERVRDQARWEVLGAASIAGMFASKYFFFLAPIPVVFVLWVTRGSKWQVSLKRWLQLIGIAAALWVCVNWSPFLPSTWEYARTYLTGQQTVHGSLFFMGRIYHNLVEYGLAGTPPQFYLVFAAVKLAPATFLCSVGGLILALLQRRPAHKALLSWLFVWFFVHSLSGSKWGRFFTSVLPAFLLLAAYFAAQVVEFLRARGVPSWVPAGALGVAVLSGEAWATVTHAPHERLYLSALGGGDRNLNWFFPHCDYFDAGFREAVQFVAAHAEPGAELSTEIDWPATLYSERAGRGDLLQTLLRRGRTCQSGRICYAVVQTGRLYFLNQEAVKNLAQREPWHIERIRGEEVVKVYRLLPGESPFPPAASH